MEPSPFFRPGTPPQDRFVVVQTVTPRKRKIRQNNVAGQQHNDDKEEHKSTLLGTSANLVNAIVGCGIVGIPYALRQCGFAAGVFLVVGVALCTERSLRLLIFTAKHIHVPSYETLAEACFGTFGFRFVAINMLLCSYGAMVTYLMVVKECFSSLLLTEEMQTPLLRRTVLFVVSLAVMFPLACRRDMADLAQTSRVNVLIDVALVGIVSWNALFAILDGRRGLTWQDDLIHWETLFVGLGVLSFAFVCQHSAFIIAGSLHDPTVKRWSTVTCGALSFSGVLALFCGIFGYLGYRDDTHGNILENLDASGVTANIARAMLGTTMCLVFPLESFVARHVLVVLLFEGRAAHDGDDAHILSRRDRRVGLTAALYILAILPAAFFNDLGPVLAISGAVGGSCLSYVGPGAVFLGVHGERFLELVKESWFRQHLRVAQSSDKWSSGHVAIAVVPSGSTARYNNASEQTPLVNDDLESRDLENTQTFLRAVLTGFVWWACGMPLWTKVAAIGMRCLKQHVHELALKSPYPIRIGGVEYKRALVTTQGETVGARIQKICAAESFPQASSAGIITYSMSSEDFKKLVMKKCSATGHTTSTQHHELEEDPQKDPPSWADFFVAICFVLLGFVAFVAGIASIFIEQRKD